MFDLDIPEKVCKDLKRRVASESFEEVMFDEAQEAGMFTLMVCSCMTVYNGIKKDLFPKYVKREFTKTYKGQMTSY